jgi:hypothetical protein
MSYTQEIKDKLHELTLNKSEDCVSVEYGYKEVNGILTDEKSIIFTFVKKKPISEIPINEVIPSHIELNGDTIRTDVKEGENYLTADVACPSSFYSWSSDSSLNPTGATTPPQRFNVRPLKGGLEIHNQAENFLGTMGFIAVDKETNSLVGVTNGHVMCDIFFGASEPNRGEYSVFDNKMGQPYGFSTGIQVGVTKRYVPIYSLPYINYVDGAIFTLDASVVDLNQSYKYDGLSFTNPPPFATTEEIDNLINNNWNFYSVGRTTGAKGEGETKLKFLSYANISVLNYITSTTQRSSVFYDCISYIASASTTPTGDRCFWPINSGDSGSALLADINGVVKIVGLSFAGSRPSGSSRFTIGRACRIDKVAEQLNIEAFTGQTVNFSDRNNPLFHYEIGSSPLSAVTINGNKYYQVGTT